jgi:hypothetical protein
LSGLSGFYREERAAEKIVWLFAFTLFHHWCRLAKQQLDLLQFAAGGAADLPAGDRRTSQAHRAALRALPQIFGVAISSKYAKLKACLDGMLDRTHLGVMRYGEQRLYHTGRVNILQFINTKREQ